MTRRLYIQPCALLAILALASCEQPPAPVPAPVPTPTPTPAPPAPLVTYAQLSAMQPVRSRRSSSTAEDWVDGNVDARDIHAGTERTVAELRGPGIIRHLWFTFGGTDPFLPKDMVLRVYWDGASEPAVESPVGDFFAVGHSLRRDVTSIPVVVSSFGKAYNCYWPMPFRKSARITVTNESPEHDGAIFWNVDWGDLNELPENTPYFHAQYRQEFPCGEGDYLVLDTDGGAGYYVGTVLSARLRTVGWFGEGDDRFAIDGEGTPSILGTGTEDYFCQAWGLHEIDTPYYGASVVEGWRPGERITAYRWHIPDPVVFTKSLRFAMEHKTYGVDPQAKNNIFHLIRHDDFSSVAFWYQTGKAKRFAPLPPMADRLYKVLQIELEDIDPATIVKPERATLDRQAQTQSSGYGRLVIDGAARGDTIEFPFTVPADDRYQATLFMSRTDESGIYRVAIDDHILSEKIDFQYEREILPSEYRLGWVELKAGEHKLRFTCVGTSTTRYQLVPDALQLTPEKTLAD